MDNTVKSGTPENGSSQPDRLPVRGGRIQWANSGGSGKQTSGLESVGFSNETTLTKSELYSLKDIERPVSQLVGAISACWILRLLWAAESVFSLLWSNASSGSREQDETLIWENFTQLSQWGMVYVKAVETILEFFRARAWPSDRDNPEAPEIPEDSQQDFSGEIYVGFVSLQGGGPTCLSLTCAPHSDPPGPLIPLPRGPTFIQPVISVSYVPNAGMMAEALSDTNWHIPFMVRLIRSAHLIVSVWYPLSGVTNTTPGWFIRAFDIWWQ